MDEWGLDRAACGACGTQDGREIEAVRVPGIDKEATERDAEFEHGHEFEEEGQGKGCYADDES